MRIVVTGNIGSGKSTFMNVLREAMPEYKFISFDDIVHGLYNNLEYTRELEQTFGTAQRDKLSNIVFKDPAKKNLLERMSEKHVMNKMLQVFDEPNMVMEFPLFVEVGSYYQLTDLLITIDCPDDVRRERIAKRDHFDEEKINSIMASQHSSEVKLALADWYVEGDNIDQGYYKMVAEEIAEDARLQDLKGRFMRTYGNNIEMWAEFKRAYEHRDRKYHTLKHLAQMFKWYDQVQLLGVRNNIAVETAIWFHDYDYYVGNQPGHNERDSVKKMWRLFKKHYPMFLQRKITPTLSVVGLASEFIMATQKHQITSPMILANEEYKRDCQIFLDIDMSIFAEDEDAVTIYDNRLFDEYTEVYSNVVFKEGRKKFLKSLMDGGDLFKSPQFLKYNLVAVSNINTLYYRYA